MQLQRYEIFSYLYIIRCNLNQFNRFGMHCCIYVNAMIKKTWQVSLFNNRFGIVFTNALARRGFLRFCDRVAVNERVLEGLQMAGNEIVVGFDRLGNPRKELKMGVLRGWNGNFGECFWREKRQPDGKMRSKVGEFGHASCGACYRSHAGNVLFPPWERMQSAILTTTKCHTSNRKVPY